MHVIIENIEIFIIFKILKDFIIFWYVKQFSTRVPSIIFLNPFDYIPKNTILHKILKYDFTKERRDHSPLRKSLSFQTSEGDERKYGNNNSHERRWKIACWNVLKTSEEERKILELVVGDSEHRYVG